VTPTSFGRSQSPLTRPSADLSPKGEVNRGTIVPPHHLSLWGRGRREAAGEGAFFKDVFK